VFIYGTGMHARKVFHALGAGGVTVGGFVHSAPQPPVVDFSDAPVLTEVDALVRSHPAAIIVAVGDPSVRRRVHEAFAAAGWRLATVIHPTAWIAPDARIGAGVFVGAAAIVETLADIGEGAIIDIGAVVDHEVHVSAFAHVKPGEVCLPRARR
jgi:UDP-3-O-[3-hydroxymyristoyl] glucosamine N-acyltransferase